MLKSNSTVATVAVVALGALSTYIISIRQAKQKRDRYVSKDEETKSEVERCTE